MEVWRLWLTVAHFLGATIELKSKTSNNVLSLLRSSCPLGLKSKYNHLRFFRQVPYGILRQKEGIYLFMRGSLHAECVGEETFIWNKNWNKFRDIYGALLNCGSADRETSGTYRNRRTHIFWPKKNKITTKKTLTLFESSFSGIKP